MNTDFRMDLSLICGDPWLLLSDAVNGAHAPDERFAVDRNHAPVGEEAL